LEKDQDFNLLQTLLQIHILPDPGTSVAAGLESGQSNRKSKLMNVESSKGGLQASNVQHPPAMHSELD
jgi:hypothetical protein